MVWPKGKKQTKEHTEKQKESRRRWLQTEEGQELLKKISKAHKGKPKPLEQRMKMSKSSMGKKCPWASLRKGKKSSYCGPRHHLWKGGITPEYDLRFTKGEWRELRKQIYQRDDWTCQKCGKHGGRLQCHHQIPWRISKNDSPKNLTTLCIPCHVREETECMKLW